MGGSSPAGFILPSGGTISGVKDSVYDAGALREFTRRG